MEIHLNYTGNVQKSVKFDSDGHLGSYACSGGGVDSYQINHSGNPGGTQGTWISVDGSEAIDFRIMESVESDSSGNPDKNQQVHLQVTSD